MWSNVTYRSNLREEHGGSIFPLLTLYRWWSYIKSQKKGQHKPPNAILTCSCFKSRPFEISPRVWIFTFKKKTPPTPTKTSLKFGFLEEFWLRRTVQPQPFLDVLPTRRVWSPSSTPGTRVWWEAGRLVHGRRWRCLGGGEFPVQSYQGHNKETSLSKVFSCCELFKL